MVNPEKSIHFTELYPNYISDIPTIVLELSFRFFLSQFDQTFSVWKCQVTFADWTFEFCYSNYF